MVQAVIFLPSLCCGDIADPTSFIKQSREIKQTVSCMMHNF